MSDKLSVAEKSGRTMVVGVEESQRLLLQDKEDGVNQFEVFRQVVHLRRSAKFSVCLSAAHVV